MIKFLKLFTFIIINISILKAEIDEDLLLDKKCGTYLSKEKKKQITQMLSVTEEDGRPKLQKSFSSPSNNFVIHYDISGENAVNPVDLNFNGVPDYVDSVSIVFDYVYNKETTGLGYQKPPSDSGLGGSDAYDVYLMNIGPQGLYGWTMPEKEILPRKKFARYSSYLVLDNDYSPFDSIYVNEDVKVQAYKEEQGINAMKVTAAHEFHHSIQAGYGDDPKTPAMNEFTSVYIETKVFPEIKDYEQFVKSLFKDFSKYVFGLASGEYFRNGYRWAIFGIYIDKIFGEESLVRWWEIIGDGYTAFEAMDRMFKEKGTTLPTEWCKFLPWLYYTNTRTVAGQYFPDAHRYPLAGIYRTNFFSPPSIIESSTLKPFEVRFFRAIFPTENPDITSDTADIIITNPDLDAAIKQKTEQTQPYIVMFSDSPQSGATIIGTSKYYYGMKNDGLAFCDRIYFTKGSATSVTGWAYPDPFKPQIDYEIFLPAPNKAFVGDPIETTIFNSEMRIIYQSKLQVEVNNNFRVVRWNKIPTDISSGIYIYRLNHSGTEDWGKFAVILTK